MKQNILHIGLDVDDTQYHGSAFNKATGEVVDFKSRPTLKGLLQQLGRIARHFKGHRIKLWSIGETNAILPEAHRYQTAI
jgi:hypothetical protein